MLFRSGPDLLLLDEPFSNLDAKLREQMRTEIKLLQRRLGISVLFVTHDQSEALVLSDHVAVMNRGRFEQLGGVRRVALRGDVEEPAVRRAAEHLAERPPLRRRPHLDLPRAVLALDHLRPVAAQHEPWLARVRGQVAAAYAGLEHEIATRASLFAGVTHASIISAVETMGLVME